MEEIKEEKKEFKLGDTFKDTYPPSAAIWCNESGKYHIEAAEEGKDYKYIIVENEVYVPTDEEVLARKESEYQMNRWQREQILAEGSTFSDFTKQRAMELEELASKLRKSDTVEEEPSKEELAEVAEEEPAKEVIETKEEA